VACADEPGAAGLTTAAQRDTYGFSAGADWWVSDYSTLKGKGSRFELSNGGRGWAVESPLIGEHNARNVAAAVAVVDHYGVGLRSALASVATFQGVRRRFETKGRPRGIWVVDDYGHHPTEVAAVLQAARAAAEGDVWVVFQPHTTNRTAELLSEFAQSFPNAQHALILPIYKPSGRESAAREVTSNDLVQAIRRHGHPDARAVDSFAAVLQHLAARPGDLVLTMGAGDVTELSDVLVRELA
jgi:UDP-N-acetylmuramate--alanine ligase